MPESQLKETTMDPRKRSLQRIILPAHIETKDIAIFVDDLMGRAPEKRFAYIQENARFVKDLDV
jgi:topoisomerase-4 subunit B